MGAEVQRYATNKAIMADTNLRYTLSLKDLFSKGMDRILGKTRQLDGAMGSLQKKADGMNKLAGTIRGGIIGGIVGAGVISFGKDVIDALSKYEYFSASLRTLLKGDALTARALNDQLISLAKTTPFKLTEVQDSSRQLLAYGFAANDVTKQLRMLGDVAAGTGQPIGELTYLFGTLRVQGRAFSKDIYQFTNRGINIMKPLAKQFNTTEDAIMGMVEKGLIGFKDVEKAFQSMTSKGGQFFGMMEEQSKTVGGKISNIADAWEQVKVNIGNSQRGIIVGTIDFISKSVNALQEYTASLNRMDEAFEKYGAKQFTWIQQRGGDIASVLGLSTKVTDARFLERSLENMYVKPAQKDKLSALNSEASLLRLMSNFSKSFANKEIDKEEYKRGMALMEAARNRIIGNKSLFDSKIDTAGGITPKTEEDKKKEVGSGTNVSSARPQNLYITINDGLVKQINIYSTTLKEGTSKVKEEVAKALLEAVNDVNNVAR